MPITVRGAIPMRGASLKSARLLAALVGAVVPCAAWAGGPLDPYLPKDGRIQGHVMTLEVAPEDQALDRRFRLAVQNNMDWFKKYVTGNKPGQPLPYDPRMGVTKAQYEKIQHMTADFKPAKAITITVRKGGDGSVAFGSDAPDAAGLKSVTFPPDDKAAETPYGALSIFNEIHQTDARAPIGVWNGVEWAQMKDNGDAEPSAKIAFGKRVPSGEGVMYYQVAPYKDHKEQSLVVFYTLD